MHVYVQKSTRTTLPPSPCGVSGSELSHPVASSNDGQVALDRQLGRSHVTVPD